MDVEYLEEYEDVLKTCQIYDSIESNELRALKEFKVDSVELNESGKINEVERNVIKKNTNKRTKKISKHLSTEESADSSEYNVRIDKNKIEPKNRIKSIRKKKSSGRKRLSKRNNLKEANGNKISNTTLLGKKRIKMKDRRRNLSSVNSRTERNISGKNDKSPEYVNSPDFIDCGGSCKIPSGVNTTPVESLKTFETYKKSDFNVKEDKLKTKKQIPLKKSKEKEFEYLADASSNKSNFCSNKIEDVYQQATTSMQRKSQRVSTFYTKILKRKKKSATLDSIQHNEIGTNKILKQKMKQNKIRKLKVVVKRLKIDSISNLKKVATGIVEKKSEQINNSVTNCKRKNSKADNKRMKNRDGKRLKRLKNKNCKKNVSFKTDYKKINNGDEEGFKRLENNNCKENATKQHKASYQIQKHKQLKKTINRNDKKTKIKILEKEIREKSNSPAITSSSLSTSKVMTKHNDQPYSESSSTSKQVQNSTAGSNNSITFYEVPAFIFVETKILTRAEYHKLKTYNDVDKPNVKSTKPKSQTLLSHRADRRNLEVLLDDIETVIDKEISKQVREKLQRISEGFSASNTTLNEEQKRKDKDVILENLHFDVDFLLKVLRFLKVYFSSTATANVLDKKKEEEKMKASVQKSKDLSLNSNLSKTESVRKSYQLTPETFVTQTSLCETTSNSNNSSLTPKLIDNESNLSDEFKFRKIKLPNRDNLSTNQKYEQNIQNTNVENRHLKTLPKIASVDIVDSEEIILPDILQHQQKSDGLSKDSKNTSHDLTANSSSSQSSVKSVILLPNPSMRKPFTNSMQISKPKQIILQRRNLKNSSMQSNNIGKIIPKPPPILAVAPIISSIEKPDERLTEDELIIPDEYVESGPKNISLSLGMNSQENQNERQSTLAMQTLCQENPL